MRQILTNSISDPGVQEPLTGPMLANLQYGYGEVFSAIIQNLIGPGYQTNAVYVLWGCVVTGVTSGAGNFAMTAGAVFLNGEVYQIAAVATISVGVGNTVWSELQINNTTVDPVNGEPLDPVTFSDGSTKNVNNNRIWITYIGATGFTQVATWRYLTPIAQYINCAAPNNPGSGFATITDGVTPLSYTTPDDSITKKYVLIGKVPVTGSGNVVAVALVIGSTTVDLNSYGDSGSTCVCIWTGSIAPNTLIRLEAAIGGGTPVIAQCSLTITQVR